MLPSLYELHFFFFKNCFYVTDRCCRVWSVAPLERWGGAVGSGACAREAVRAGWINWLTVFPVLVAHGSEERETWARDTMAEKSNCWKNKIKIKPSLALQHWLCLCVSCQGPRQGVVSHKGCRPLVCGVSRCVSLLTESVYQVLPLTLMQIFNVAPLHVLTLQTCIHHRAWSQDVLHCHFYS